MRSHDRGALSPKRPFWSAPNTTNNSPDLGRKAVYHQRQPHSRDDPEATEMFTKVVVGELDDRTPRPSIPLVITAECFLFLVMTSLTVLTMVAAMTVLVLHFVSGGKIFLKNRDDGKNSTSPDLRPHFNFKT